MQAEVSLVTRTSSVLDALAEAAEKLRKADSSRLKAGSE